MAGRRARGAPRRSPLGDLARWAAHPHPAIRRAVALHVAATPDTLVTLARDPAPVVRHAAATNPRCPSLDPLAADPSLEVSRAALANPRCPLAASERALAGGRRVDVLQNPLLPAALVRRIADEGLADVRYDLLVHPLPGCHELLDRFADAAYRYEQGELLARPDCPPSVVAAAAEDPKLAARAATHPALPESSRTALASHADPAVRAAAAAPPSPRAVPLWTYWENRFLLAHPDAAVRLALARMPSTPRHVLLALADDASPEVRRAVAERPAAHVQALRWACRRLTRIRSRFVEHPDCPAGSLVAAARAGAPRNDRVSALAHPSFPSDELARHAASGESLVRGAVARNPWCDAATLVRLARDANTYVRSYVASHPNAPAEALALSRPPPAPSR